MTPNAQRAAIAEACGWTMKPFQSRHGAQKSMWHHPNGTPMGFTPDYLKDLNAIRYAVLKLFPNQVPQGFYHPLWNALMDNLKVATGHEPNHWNEYDLMTASAAEWAQAIVKTINQWKENA